ncbi:hypothetical protein F3Y22_tig00000738pilonHSYRG00091 [Hibiscus syriacus]|uniref:SHSP domain-containing protein n=1 Tax=Hibiscus syriacus TaxID=106335 RepID=A0A6A3D1X7_HIBSY|nr:uncharacterized protein LOC120213764 [Hibiscus syriacus]KAE8734624.1 hypothetical protein F3Y22_tig00000738pilonHSYRG00091 [Hibiscus syriacus]
MKNEENTEPCYDDFQPYCQWRKEVGASIIQEVRIVEIHLQGFKEEELKNEMKWDGCLYISGEHPMGKNKIKRLSKRIDVSKYDIKGIEAKFEGGKLILRLPCKSSTFSLLTNGRGNAIGILHLHEFLKSSMALALLIILGFYIYKYSQCTYFGN